MNITTQNLAKTNSGPRKFNCASISGKDHPQPFNTEKYTMGNKSNVISFEMKQTTVRVQVLPASVPNGLKITKIISFLH